MSNRLKQHKLTKLDDNELDNGKLTYLDYEVSLVSNAGFYYVFVYLIGDEKALTKRRSFSDRAIAEKEYYETIGRLEAE